MQVDLSAHGLSPRFSGSRFLNGSASDFFSQTAKNIASDRSVRVTAISAALSAVTGVSPVVDTRDPSVTWIRTVPKHGEYVDSLFLKHAKGKPGKPADVKIDVGPALMPLVYRRVLPVALVLLGIAFGVGYFVGRD